MAKCTLQIKNPNPKLVKQTQNSQYFCDLHDHNPPANRGCMLNSSASYTSIWPEVLFKMPTKCLDKGGIMLVTTDPLKSLVLGPGTVA